MLSRIVATQARGMPCVVAVIETPARSRCLQQCRRAAPLRRASQPGSSPCSRPSPMAQPTSGAYASAHQPSSSERFRPPFTSTFMPLVPLASQGRRGVLIQTSTPCTSCWVMQHVVVAQENDAAGAPRDARMNSIPLADHAPGPAWSCGMRLAGEDQLHGAARIGEDAQEARRGRSAGGWDACRWRSGARSRGSARRGRRCARRRRSRAAGRPARRAGGRDAGARSRSGLLRFQCAQRPDLVVGGTARKSRSSRFQIAPPAVFAAVACVQNSAACGDSHVGT